MINNAAFRLRERTRALAKSALHASPAWLQPKLRSGHRAVRERAARQRPKGPLLSVVVPAYQVEEYLPACLDSLLAQRYKNLEIIVVDDGSPDGSAAITREYAQRDRRICLISRPNGGLAAARNTGIDAATGEYLAFCDSDDIVLPDAYQAAMSSLSRTGSDFAVFAYQRMDSSHRWPPPPWIRQAHTSARLRTNLTDFPEAQVNAVAWSKVYRRSFWEAQRLRFPAGVVYEDQPVSTRAYATATAFDFLPGRYYLWRRRDDQSSISQQTRSVADLRARFVAAQASLAILGELGLPTARDARLIQLLSNDFPQSIVLTAVTDQDFWACLRDGILALSAQASPAVWAAVAPQLRLVFELITTDQRAETMQLIHSSGGNLANLTTRMVDHQVRTSAPNQDLPGLIGDPTRSRGRSDRRPIQTAIRRVVWTTPTALTIDGWAYIEDIDLAKIPTQITLLVINRATGAVKSIRTSPSIDSTISALSDDKRRNYEAAAFSVTINTTEDEWPNFDGGETGVETWNVDVQVETAGIRAEGPLCGFYTSGSAGVPQARERPDGLRTAWLASESGQLELTRSYPQLQLEHGSIDGNSISLRVRAEELTLRSLILRDGPQGRALSTTLDRDTDGTYVAQLELPVAGSDHSTWSVKAVTTDDREVTVSCDSKLAETLASERGEEFAGVWLARTPMGDITIAQQQQRCRMLLAHVSDDAASLIVHADADGDVEFTATLQSGRLEQQGALERVGRRLQLRFPLTASQWGGPTLPIPPGRYELDLRSGSGPEAVRVSSDLADPVLAALPIEVEHAQLRGRLERTSNDGHLCLTVTTPLAPDERGARHQRELQAHLATLAARQPSTRHGHTVLFRSSYGENAACNAAAVHRELRRRHADLDLYWTVSDYSIPIPDGGIPVIADSHAWYHLLATASFFIDNMHQPIYHHKPDHQVIIETFHGYPFKRMGHPHWRNLGFSQARIDSFDRRAREWDYLVSPATYATPLLRREFHYDGDVLEIGYPRNDILQSDQAPARRKLVRERLGIAPHHLAVLYAPTFRDYLSRDDHHADMVDFLDLRQVADDFGDDAVLLLRGHAFNARAGGGTGYTSPNIVDVSTYPDVADLYLAADAAITDYSSLRFDFALTGKPMIFHVPDLARYRDESRGWLLDFNPTAPGPLVETTEQVLHEVRRLDHVRRTYDDAYQQFRRTYLDLDDGHAAERFVDAVFVPRGYAPPLESVESSDPSR